MCTVLGFHPPIHSQCSVNLISLLFLICGKLFIPPKTTQVSAVSSKFLERDKTAPWHSQSIAKKSFEKAPLNSSQCCRGRHRPKCKNAHTNTHLYVTGRNKPNKQKQYREIIKRLEQRRVFLKATLAVNLHFNESEASDVSRLYPASEQI